MGVKCAAPTVYPWLSLAGSGRPSRRFSPCEESYFIDEDAQVKETQLARLYMRAARGRQRAGVWRNYWLLG
jgi:hypothetical protein